MEPNKLKELVDQIPLTQKEIARKLGISAAWLSMWLSGDRVVPAWAPLALRQLRRTVTANKARARDGD